MIVRNRFPQPQSSSSHGNNFKPSPLAQERAPVRGKSPLLVAFLPPGGEAQAAILGAPRAWELLSRKEYYSTALGASEANGDNDCDQRRTDCLGCLGSTG